MGSKAVKPSPPPDMSGLVAAMNAKTAQDTALQQQQLDFARQAYDENKKVTDEVISKSMEQQDVLFAQAQDDRKRYDELFSPIEKELSGRAMEDPRARAEAVRNRIMKTAQADAQLYGTQAAQTATDQFALARQAAEDQLESYGLDPGQVRSGAIDTESRLAEAAARAGAYNQTALGFLQQGRSQSEAAATDEERYSDALRMKALDLGGRRLTGALAAQGLGLNAGTSAAGLGTALTASGTSSMGSPTQWGALASQGLGQTGSTMNSGYRNVLDYTKSINEANKESSGLGALAGIAGGVAASGFKMPAWTFADGGAVPDTDLQPNGMPVLPTMSPTRGGAIDDVPARLNAGEFVVPEDVVRWKGEEFFQKTIAKSREARKESPAKPQIGALPMGPTMPTAAGALPIRRAA